jgi:hypothetical protein
MEAVTPFVEYAGSHAVVFGEHQPEYTQLPALVFADGKVLIEWTFTKEEREAIAKGENLRHWIWKIPTCHACGAPRLFEPVMLEVAADHRG